jgi:hypothetical protein
MGDANARMQREKIEKALMGAAILTLLIVAVVYGPPAWRMRSPQQAVRSYNRALVKKDYAVAYDLLADETSAAGNLDSLTQVQQQLIEKHGALRGFEEGPMTTRQDSGMKEIHATLIYEKDKVPCIFLVKKENLLWRIYSAAEE